jgi:glycolate oxidase FAD binding subunit
VDIAVLDKLRAVVGPANVLGDVDLAPYVVEGRTPEAALMPGSVDEVRAVVEIAAGAGIPVVPWGGGTAAAVGTPASRPGLVLDLRRLGQLLEHEPGDLTATVEAGMTMATLQSALRARGQWLSLDPPDPERATIGGVIATNASGPRRQLYGTARDLLIGVTVVTGDGVVVRGGGKVVKNVAGYDLPKLFVGSHGTLGIIVSVTIKLRPLPEDERLVAVVFDRAKDAGAAARAVLGSDLIPNALDLIDAEAARPLGLESTIGPGQCALIVGFDGVGEQVEWQCGELDRIAASFGGHAVPPLPAGAWARLASAARDAFDPPAAVMKLVVLPAAVTEAVEQGASAARQRRLRSAWSCHAGVGVITAALASGSAPPEPGPIASVLHDWRALARASGGHATLDWAPLAVKSSVPVWDEAGAAGRIMQRLKASLDPHNVLNPGRFVAGI